jgi:biopolymer transport protein ExbD
VKLNGVMVADLAAALRPLMDSPGDAIVLRADGADVQALVAVMESLRAEGMTKLIMVP